MSFSTSVRQPRRRRQPRPQRTYQEGEQITVSANYPPGSKSIAATIEKISRKVSSVRNFEIVTYTLAVDVGPKRAIVMSDSEFRTRVREAN